MMTHNTQCQHSLFLLSHTRLRVLFICLNYFHSNGRTLEPQLESYAFIMDSLTESWHELSGLSYAVILPDTFTNTNFEIARHQGLRMRTGATRTSLPCVRISDFANFYASSGYSLWF